MNHGSIWLAALYWEPARERRVSHRLLFVAVLEAEFARRDIQLRRIRRRT